MKLNDAQRKMVEDNHNLIYWYISRHNLDINEYYDLLAIELCHTAMKHDESRGSFANYFKLRVDGRIRNEYRDTQAQKRLHTKVALLDNLHTIVDDCDLLDVIELTDLIDGENGDIVRLKIEGYSQSEIADILGTNQSRVSKILKKIKQDYEGRSSSNDR